MRRFPRFSALRLAVLLGSSVVVMGCTSVSLDEPIEARIWRLASLGQQPVLPGADPKSDPQLLFDGVNGRISGSGGCNRISGRYQREGYRLRIETQASTRAACTNVGRNALESSFIAALRATVRYRLGGGELELLDANGQRLAILQ